MRLSKLTWERFKEKPADTNCISHAILIKGGYIKQVGAGLYTLTPIAQKINLKIQNIVREEMNKLGGQECLFPVMMPRTLWDESGRYSSIGSEMFRLKDRQDKDMVLGMTHEEAAVHLVRTENDSYKRYPFMVYQIQTKLRDEPRPRAGLIRVREFTMKDAYSFHTSEKSLEEFYNRTLEVYKTIYKRCGLETTTVVKSSTGMMGGKKADEFMCICEAGEDKLLICDKCAAAYNQEVATTIVLPATSNIENIKEIFTPDVKTIDDLVKLTNIPASKMCKAVVYGYNKNKVCVCFIRADRDINEDKLQAILKSEVYILSDISETNLCAGFIGPYNFVCDKNTTVLYDSSLKNETSLIVGANKINYHVYGFNFANNKEISYVDINKVVGDDICNSCGGKFVEKKGVEIGNIFHLAKKYPESMNMTYLDENGKKQFPYMGCYGIGIGRILACLVEEHNDDYGPIWPKQVAPFDIEICPLGGNENIKLECEKLYNDFLAAGIDVLIDDRNLSVGITLADADLIAAPFRIILGNKNFENQQVEIKSRDKKIDLLVNYDEALSTVKNLLKI